MSDRLKRAPENGLVDKMVRLRLDVDGLKAIQRVGGTNVQGYLARTAGDYFVSYTIAASSKINKVISHIPPDAHYVPIMQLYLYYAFNPDVVTYAVPPYSNGPPVSMAVQDMIVTGVNSQWWATFTNNTTSPQTIYLKLFFNGTSLGSVAIGDPV